MRLHFIAIGFTTIENLLYLTLYILLYYIWHTYVLISGLCACYKLRCYRVEMLPDVRWQWRMTRMNLKNDDMSGLYEINGEYCRINEIDSLPLLYICRTKLQTSGKYRKLLKIC